MAASCLELIPDDSKTRRFEGIRIHEVATGRTAALFPEIQAQVLAFSPDERYLAAFCTQSRDVPVIRIWELSSRRLLNQINADNWDLHTLVFSPDGLLIVGGGRSKMGESVGFWEVSSGKIGTVWSGHPGYVQFLAFTADGTALVSACGQGDFLVRKLAKGDLLHQFKIGRQPSAVALTPQDQLLAIPCNRTAGLRWDLATGAQSATALGQGFRGLSRSEEDKRAGRPEALSPNGRLASLKWIDFRLALADITTGQVVKTLRGPQYFRITFSPDSRYLAYSTLDAVHIWDVSDLVGQAKER